MLKSFAQQELEQRHPGKDVRQIVTETLDELRGKPRLIEQAAVKLMISGQTLRNWCDDLNINIDDYRRLPKSSGSANHA
jgi:hypothetical protein